MKDTWRINDKDFEKFLGSSELNLKKIEGIVRNFKPDSCFPYTNEYSCRFSENWRSCSIGLEGGLTLIIKGSELKSNDINDCYEKVFSKVRKVGMPTLAEHFVYKEGKFPLAFELDEALEEAKTTIQLLKDYWKNYKKIPSIPIPLFVIAYEDEDLNDSMSYLNSIRKKIKLKKSNNSFAVFAYLYKGHPSRLKHWKILTENPQLARKDWQKNQADFFSSKDLLNKYIDLFIEISSLNWILAPIGQDHIGYGLKSQNLTLDGGMVDLGNAYKVENVDRSVKINFINSLNFLTDSIKSLLIQNNRMSDDFENNLISNLVIQMINKKWNDKDCLLYSVFKNVYFSDEERFFEELDELLGDNISEDFDIIL